ncbi:MAG: bifunctional biotin--[acetyl-CoA-carboxylase] ligase/biotin operon repressor BirA [Gammaproteobacteria bacterium]|nr:bifunctional biotin--[acetyl-CoA-carboxylase] ligase/biotin operon repressor BirA [Gammaproteobacteria bacterium]
MSLKYALIKLLADGKFHSGEELGQSLQITRSAIWKMIKQIAEMGIDIQSVKGKGYKIDNGLDLLNLDAIKNKLSDSALKQVHLEVLNEVDSTNQYLLNHASEKKSGTIVFAEYQKQGRGRRLRKWISPFGGNIIFSILWSFNKDPSELGGLSLAAGVAVANALERVGIHNIKLKWPNDILWDNKKIAGILIEMSGESYSTTQVIIGIGINIHMPSQVAIDQQWIDLARITGQRPERNCIAAYIVEEIIEMMTIFQQKGFKAYAKYWRALDAYYDQQVEISTPSKKYVGIAKGINANGELLLQTAEEKEVRFLHGEVSLRLAAETIL